MPRKPLVERRYLTAFALTATLFFSWALASQFNDVLIHHFQKALDLTRIRASFTQLAFYIGYFCAPLPGAFIIRRIGYKATMIIGLLLYALGAFLFTPAAHIRIYGLFLLALYIIAFGVAFLETSANPYITILGDPSTGSARLNFAQAFNGVGAVLGPIVGGRFIFSGIEYSPRQLMAMTPAAQNAWRAREALSVGPPYLVVALVMCVVAAAIALTRYPALYPAISPQSSTGSPFLVLKKPRVVYAVIAQFFYVGAQVGIWSLFVDFSKEALPSIPERTAAYLLSASLVAFTIGRFSGAWMQRYLNPARQLALYALLNILLCILAATAGGIFSIAALWSTSFFMSVMFPTIFALGVENLGHQTEFAGSFIVMAISGGAVMPPLMAWISELVHGLHWALFVPATCYGVVLSFAIFLLGRGDDLT